MNKLKKNIKGFTLIELIITLIIIGVLVTLGFTQYGRIIERSRSAEAKQVFKQLRDLGVALYLANGRVDGLGNVQEIQDYFGIGTEGIPNNCQVQSSHYFVYAVQPYGASPQVGLAFMAARCNSLIPVMLGGKYPPANRVYLLQLQTDFSTGQDTWMCIGNCP